MLTAPVNAAPALLGALGLKQAGILPSTCSSHCIPLSSFEGETAGVAGLCSLQVICEVKEKLGLFPGLLLLSN